MSCRVCSVDTEKCQELDLFLLQGSICNQIYTFLVYASRAFGSSSLEQDRQTLLIVLQQAFPFFDWKQIEKWRLLFVESCTFRTFFHSLDN